MFEGKPPAAPDAYRLEEPLEGESLRPLSWSDLVARLSAARDLRASLEGSEASFDAGSARRIAAHHNGKSPINPDDLANGKGPERISNPAVHSAPIGVART